MIYCFHAKRQKLIQKVPTCRVKVLSLQPPSIFDPPAVTTIILVIGENNEV
jgi:hypothetical protein